jgi:mannose-1-phosphate guanylyltransferase
LQRVLEMKLVLLSGGSGKRLWPLSNDSRSKQFLKVLKNPKNGLESMVQRVWRQLGENNLNKSTYISTNRAHLDTIRSQIGVEIPVILEPESRDTFPAVALVATYLYTIAEISLDEVICILPVDPFVESQFYSKIIELEAIINESNADLALVGVQPNYPSEKYGYIVPEPTESFNNINSYKKVRSFTEKPNVNEASKLIQQNALWNCGVFSFRLSYIINLLKNKGIPTQYELLLQEYNKLLKTSFDYEVVEKSNQTIVVPFYGDWKDLGTWNTLTEEMDTPLIGKGIISEDSNNTHLVNELDIPIAILGLSDIVVAASPDGILVSDKSASPRIKELAINFDQRPMFEERRWGWYRVLDYTKFNNKNEVLTKRIGILAGKNLSYQFHYKRSEVWTIISGEGEFVLNGKIIKVSSGDVLQIPVGAKHGIKAKTDLEIIEVQSGSELIEEDIVRIYMTWEEVETYCLRGER